MVKPAPASLLDSASPCFSSSVLQRTREQYRISGQLRVVTHEEADASLQAARREQWASLSDNARLQVRATHPPTCSIHKAD